MNADPNQKDDKQVGPEPTLLPDSPEDKKVKLENDTKEIKGREQDESIKNSK